MVDEISTNLQKFGLSEYQSKTMSALIQKQTATASEIVEKSGVPPTKIYSILESIMDLGFATSSMERPKKYTTISTEKIIESLICRHEDKIKALRKEKKSFLKTMVTKDKTENMETLEKAFYVGNSNAAWQEMALMMGRARKSVQYVGDKEAWLETSRRKDIITALENTSIKTETIMPETMSFIAISSARTFQAPENKIRHTMVIRDSEEIALAIKDRHNMVQAAIIMKDKNLAKEMQEYFDSLKKSSREIEAA